MTPSHSRTFALLALLAPLALAAAAPACSSSTTPVAATPDSGTPVTPGACPNDIPTSCAAPAPSWASEAMPIFAQRCWGCHADGGVEVQSDDLGSYAKIAADKTTVLGQIGNCRMPPSDADPLTTSERATLLHWLACGAPNP